jgi:hypothetical protein
MHNSYKRKLIFKLQKFIKLTAKETHGRQRARVGPSPRRRWPVNEGHTAKGSIWQTVCRVWMDTWQPRVQPAACQSPSPLYSAVHATDTHGRGSVVSRRKTHGRVRLPWRPIPYGICRVSAHGRGSTARQRVYRVLVDPLPCILPHGSEVISGSDSYTCDFICHFIGAPVLMYMEARWSYNSR